MRELTSLKCFCENVPQYRIMAADSLLGVAIKREGYSLYRVRFKQVIFSNSGIRRIFTAGI